LCRKGEYRYSQTLLSELSYIFSLSYSLNVKT
jgi:hypothetical protein